MLDTDSTKGQNQRHTVISQPRSNVPVALLDPHVSFIFIIEWTDLGLLERGCRCFIVLRCTLGRVARLGRIR
jgi:hypothetical protein